jgi:hypothetical protein
VIGDIGGAVAGRGDNNNTAIFPGGCTAVAVGNNGVTYVCPP